MKQTQLLQDTFYKTHMRVIQLQYAIRFNKDALT